jgi:hypothetical protein
VILGRAGGYSRGIYPAIFDQGNRRVNKNHNYNKKTEALVSRNYSEDLKQSFAQPIFTIVPQSNVSAAHAPCCFPCIAFASC